MGYNILFICLNEKVIPYSRLFTRDSQLDFFPHWPQSEPLIGIVWTRPPESVFSPQNLITAPTQILTALTQQEVLMTPAICDIEDMHCIACVCKRWGRLFLRWCTSYPVSYSHSRIIFFGVLSNFLSHILCHAGQPEIFCDKNIWDIITLLVKYLLRPLAHRQ